jgi:CHAT domain
LINQADIKSAGGVAPRVRTQEELYASLFGAADALIKDRRHLLIVPSGPLTALPFHLLVTQKAESAAKDSSVFARYRDAAWLIKRQAITILPSVPSLKALRFSARTDESAKPLIGFGDPLFRAEENIAFDSPGKEGGRIQVASRSARGYAEYWQGSILTGHGSPTCRRCPSRPTS